MKRNATVEKKRVYHLHTKRLVDIKKPNLVADDIQRLINHMEVLSRRSVMDPGMTVKYFNEIWYPSFKSMMQKAFPDVVFRTSKLKPLSAAQYMLAKVNLGYGIVMMNRQYSNNEFYVYVFKKGGYRPYERNVARTVPSTGNI